MAMGIASVVLGAVSGGAGGAANALLQLQLAKDQYQYSSLLSSQGFQQNSQLSAQNSQQLMQQNEQYQTWYSGYMTQLTDQKFQQQQALVSLQGQLNGMNTNSALMNSHANSNSISSSTPASGLTSQYSQLYPGVLSGNVRNQGSQANLETRSASTSTSDGSSGRPMVGNSQSFTSEGANFAQTQKEAVSGSEMTPYVDSKSSQTNTSTQDAAVGPDAATSIKMTSDSATQDDESSA